MVKYSPFLKIIAHFWGALRLQLTFFNYKKPHSLDQSRVMEQEEFIKLKT